MINILLIAAAMVFIAFFSFIAVIILGPHLIFWHSLWKSSPVSTSPTLRSLGYAFIVESFHITRKALRRILKLILGFKDRPLNTHAAHAVVLVHGYLGHPEDWGYLRRYLKQENYAVYCVSLPHFDGIKAAALQLQQSISCIHGDYKKLSLIGHSMGGLVCSYYAEYLSPPAKLSQVITLGSPFHGSHLAGFAHGQSQVDLSPKTDLLKKLALSLQKSSHRYYHVASRSDTHVYPWSGAVAVQQSSEPSNCLILENVGHLSLLYSKTVAKRVLQWLTHA
jgi:triacylglycerol lipase